MLSTNMYYVYIIMLSWSVHGGVHGMPLPVADTGDKFMTQGHVSVKAQRRSDGGPAAPRICDWYAEA